MKKFADLYLRPRLDDFNQVKAMIHRASELGYRLVGVSLPLDAKEDEIRHLKEVCSNVGIDLTLRMDLTPKDRRELLEGLRRFRRRFEVLAVRCLSKPVARQAAKDRRVDILSFSADPRKRFFDRAEAELASGTFASLEVEMSPLLLLRGLPRIRLLHRLRSEVEIAQKFHVPIIISSGATHERFLRAPRDLAALTSLFDMDVSLALRALSEVPLALVERNREKLSPNYVAEGVRIVRRGRNCCVV